MIIMPNSRTRVCASTAATAQSRPITPVAIIAAAPMMATARAVDAEERETPETEPHVGADEDGERDHPVQSALVHDR